MVETKEAKNWGVQFEKSFENLLSLGVNDFKERSTRYLVKWQASHSQANTSKIFQMLKTFCVFVDDERPFEKLMG